MPTYFLRVEGVNLGTVIDDTDDLSTRRGGGLMVLNAIRQMKDHNQQDSPGTLDKEVRDRLKIISSGASIGLFTFEATDDKAANKVADNVREHFRTGTLEYQDRFTEHKTFHLPLIQGTFVVDVVPVGANEQKSEQLAVAMNRWRQLQEPTMSLDGLWDPATEPCFADRTRPANSRERLPKDANKPKQDQYDVSKSVLLRHQYGRNAKQKFYLGEWEALEGSGAYPDFGFTNDFQEIAKLPEDDKNPLRDKLAVFYVDGNSFGQKGRDSFRDKGAAGFGQWSDDIQKHHRKLLHDLLLVADADPRWKNGPSIRLETLLWGGDEILFVVPAWKGWELAKWFFAQKHELPDGTLSYSAGMVFCHAKAPIKNVTALAKEKIAETAKEIGRPIDKHRLSYEVLESFDDIHGDLKEYRRRWLPSSTEVESLILDPAKPFWGPLHQIAESKEFPMRQLYQLCKAWRKGENFQAITRRLMEDQLREPVTAFLKAFDDHPAAWLHLLQMLPYTPTGGER
jgi:hypothetical protein